MNFCWIWQDSCKGDDYAAWVAAIGTILALVSAIGISWYQNWAETIRKTKELRDRRKRQIVEIVCLTEIMKEIITEIIDQPTYDKPIMTEKVGDTLNAIRMVNTDMLDSNEYYLYIKLRGDMSTIFTFIHIGNAIMFAPQYIELMQDYCDRFKSYHSLLA